MSKPNLRVHCPDDNQDDAQRVRPFDDRRQRELDRLSGTAEPKRVTLPVGKLVPLLLDAAQHQRTWLHDFADDPVQIDADLYDVLLAYQKLRQQAA